MAPGSANVLDGILGEGEGLDFDDSARLSREASLDVGAIEKPERCQGLPLAHLTMQPSHAQSILCAGWLRQSPRLRDPVRQLICPNLRGTHRCPSKQRRQIRTSAHKVVLSVSTSSLCVA